LFLSSGHPIQGTIQALLPEFEELTGVTVVIDVLPEEEYFEKLNVDLARGKGTIDVFMTSPIYHWQYAKAGWIEGLSKYIDDPKFTDKDWYDPDDFFPVLWKASMWDGTIGGGLGQGELYSIPVWWEGSALMYCKDLAEKYGFTEPKSWEDLYDQVAKIKSLSGGEMYGFAGRGIRSWSQIHTYHMTMMASYGGRDIDPTTGKAAFNSPIGVQVGEYWVKMMKDASSPDWPKYNWYEVASEFQAGRYFAIMDANPFSIMLEADNSPIKGKVGYLLPPPGPEGRKSFLWIWALGMNSNSAHKGASWLFIEWATSKHILRLAIENGNWMAARQSVWTDPEVVKMLSAIDEGRWYENSDKLLNEYVDFRWSPNPLAATVGDLWAGAIQDAWAGKYTVQEALDRAANEVDTLMKEEGYSK
jgi:multiple sugar transport system substrate-binding protein